MTTRHTEADARIAIDDRLRPVGRDPLDKSMVGTEVHAAESSASGPVVDRSRERPSCTTWRLPRAPLDPTGWWVRPATGPAGCRCPIPSGIRRRLLEAGSDEPRCWWAPFDAVAENDYDLNASRYKPRVAKAVPDEDPAELMREVLAMEREIATGLEKPLEEME